MNDNFLNHAYQNSASIDNFTTKVEDLHTASVPVLPPEIAAKIGGMLRLLQDLRQVTRRPTSIDNV